jgi:predicted transglutaminase-like cysteine proteinase
MSSKGPWLAVRDVALWVPIVAGRKTLSIRARRQSIVASFVLAFALAALPVRHAPAADSGDRQAATEKSLHHSADKTSRQRQQEMRSPAHRQVASANFDTPSLEPMAFLQFCLRYPQDCKGGGEADQEAVILTQTRLTDLLEVNRVVNHLIKPRPAASISKDEWRIAPAQGDCSDYAVTKRHALLARGWPSGALLLAEVILASGEHHLVLLIRAREADLVLDNLEPGIRAASQSAYRWIRMQRADNPYYWLAASAAPARSRTASPH